MIQRSQLGHGPSGPPLRPPLSLLIKVVFNQGSTVPFITGRARLDRPSRSRAHFLSMIGKYFLFVRTGTGAPQIDPGDFNRARPLYRVHHRKGAATGIRKILTWYSTITCLLDNVHMALGVLH